MLSTFLSILVIGAVILVLFSLFGKAKLQRRVKSWWGRQQDEVADKFGDKITDHEDNLAQANVDVVEFRRKVAKLMAEVDISQQKHADAVRRAEKWAGIAAQAAKAGDEENVRRCVVKQKQAEDEAVVIAEQSTKNAALADKLQAQLNSRSTELERAESNSAALKARAAGLAMRKSMVESSTAFGGKGALGNLNALEEELNREEAEVDAMDKIGGPSVEDLERMYTVDTSVEDEVSKLMAANKKEVVSL